VSPVRYEQGLYIPKARILEQRRLANLKPRRLSARYRTVAYRIYKKIRK
jgi:hypothetical protein